MLGLAFHRATGKASPSSEAGVERGFEAKVAAWFACLVMEGTVSNPTTAIRRAVHADVPRIMTIRHAVRENRLSDPNAVTAAHCVAFIDRAEIWVWVEDGLIQGFAAGDPRDGQIFALFVEPSREGRGIGQALLPLACATLRNAGHTIATLSTDPGTRGERFYRANGWTPTGVNGKGEIVFEKRLVPA
jgi:GNAT superfamily N-acetyltransferase